MRCLNTERTRGLIFQVYATVYSADMVEWGRKILKLLGLKGNLDFGKVTRLLKEELIQIKQ